MKPTKYLSHRTWLFIALLSAMYLNFTACKKEKACECTKSAVHKTTSDLRCVCQPDSNYLQLGTFLDACDYNDEAVFNKRDIFPGACVKKEAYRYLVTNEGGCNCSPYTLFDSVVINLTHVAAYTSPLNHPYQLPISASYEYNFWDFLDFGLTNIKKTSTEGMDLEISKINYYTKHTDYGYSDLNPFYVHCNKDNANRYVGNLHLKFNADNTYAEGNIYWYAKYPVYEEDIPVDSCHLVWRSLSTL
ncbi:MAG: hypothetical protein R2798_05615 [Chitinophagales bacterium]|nr:hypothetical protein [Bacteroidota bacterium]MCB9042604.1 hypothetical protein [Chitinophagales bacterium]